VIHGCFWHGHDCRYFKLPATNTEFWRRKIDQNRQRDKCNLTLQLDNGWRCLVVWECAVRASRQDSKQLDAVSLSAQWLAGDSVAATIDEHGLKEQS
jgi:DNA mismatch endonuclease (patch repair protein)